MIPMPLSLIGAGAPNTIIDAGNGRPGVSMHSHVFNQNLNDNQIVGNQISGNGPDSDPGTTVPTGIDVFSDDTGGAAPIIGTVILQNVIKEEGLPSRLLRRWTRTLTACSATLACLTSERDRPMPPKTGGSAQPVQVQVDAEVCPDRTFLLLRGSLDHSD